MRSLIVAGNLCQDAELLYPFYRLSVCGEVDVLSNTWPIAGISGIQFNKHINHENVKLPGQALPKHYDLLVLIGGVKSLEKIRQDPWFPQAVSDCMEVGIPIGSICHGGQLLIEADVIKGKRCLAYYSIKTDLINAGGIWAEDEDEDPGYVIDGNLVSTAHYRSMPQWMEACIGMVKEKEKKKK